MFAMIEVHTAIPHVRLREFVRIYAQREVSAEELGREVIVEPIPARLEQTLEFQFGERFNVQHWEGYDELTPDEAIIGAQVRGVTKIELRPGVISFGIFFSPVGFSRLFGLPVTDLTGKAYDAALVSKLFSSVRLRLADCVTFPGRVQIIEEMLFRFAGRLQGKDTMVTIAERIFSQQGVVRIPQLATESGLGARQFERRFLQTVGMSPKRFARVARFQTALDAKIAAPRRSWSEIAQHLRYYDQMHMIHDFQLLGGATPHELLAGIGDARPTAGAKNMKI